MGVVQSHELQVWLPEDNQAVDWVVWPIPSFGPVCPGSQATDPCAHLREVSDVDTRAADEVGAHPSTLGLCAQAAEPLIWMHT